MKSYIVHVIILLSEILLLMAMRAFLLIKYSSRDKENNKTNLAFAVYYVFFIISFMICLFPILSNQSSLVEIILKFSPDEIWINLLKYFSFYLFISCALVIIFHFISGFICNTILVKSDPVIESVNENTGYFLVRGVIIMFLSVVSNPLISSLIEMYRPIVISPFYH